MPGLVCASTKVSDESMQVATLAGVLNCSSLDADKSRMCSEQQVLLRIEGSHQTEGLDF